MCKSVCKSVCKNICFERLKLPFSVGIPVKVAGRRNPASPHKHKKNPQSQRLRVFPILVGVGGLEPPKKSA
nr:MAG TPA_asm: hypothetical protein [Caudoviricetes sp.]